MVKNLLAIWMPGPIEMLVTFIICLVPIFFIVIFVRFAMRSSKDRKKLIKKMDELSKELEKVQQGAKDSQTKSNEILEQ